jgi:3-dehydroquinate synthase II
VSLLSPSEGLLVGCFARGLFLLGSEAEATDYAPARPFRVNAGAGLHYVLQPQGETTYLSELRAGSVVLVCDSQGSTRSVTVGRVKVETRPLTLVEARTADGDMLAVLLQVAPTAKLLARDGGLRSGTDVQIGETVLVLRLKDAARHVGKAIDEKCTER